MSKSELKRMAVQGVTVVPADAIEDMPGVKAALWKDVQKGRSVMVRKGVAFVAKIKGARPVLAFDLGVTA